MTHHPDLSSIPTTQKQLRAVTTKHLINWLSWPNTMHKNICNNTISNHLSDQSGKWDQLPLRAKWTKWLCLQKELTGYQCTLGQLYMRACGMNRLSGQRGQMPNRAITIWVYIPVYILIPPELQTSTL